MIPALPLQGKISSSGLRNMNYSSPPLPSGLPDRVAEGTQILVLVVERDPHVRALEAHFLKQAGFEVAFSADGREARAQARERLPEILITEVLVPKLDGLALCRQIKQDERTSHISVLVFSILAASSRATEAGADAFLMKPLAEHRLISTVNSLIARRQTSKG